MSKHTATPWETWNSHGSTIFRNWRIGERNTTPGVVRPIAVVCNEEVQRTSEEQAANADFIVRACNAHDDLLEACKEAAEWLESGANGDAWALAPAKTLRAALAKAEGRA